MAKSELEFGVDFAFWLLVFFSCSTAHTIVACRTHTHTHTEPAKKRAASCKGKRMVGVTSGGVVIAHTIN